MNDQAEIAVAVQAPFARVAHGVEGHFRLSLYGAVLRVIERIVAASASFEAALEAYPFLALYANELADHGLAGVPAAQAAAQWDDWVGEWERGHEGHLPLRALRNALGLGNDEMALLMTAGLPEEDARFGALFELLNGTQGLRRPTSGLLATWWSGTVDVMGLARRLRACGLIAVLNPEAPRAEWQLAVPERVWDAMRGALPERAASWVLHKPVATLTPLDELVLDARLAGTAAAMARLLAAGEAISVLVRGAQGNGRRTVLGALARAAGRGVLEVSGLEDPEDARWREVAPLATLLHAMPVIAMEPPPGETTSLPPLAGYDGPVGVVLGNLGGVSGARLGDALCLELENPGPEERRRHWVAAFGDAPVEDLDRIAQGFRLTRANIRRTAALARRHASLDGRQTVRVADVQVASGSLNRVALDTLAARVGPAGDWGDLATTEGTLNDLRQLELRCRYRESLARLAGPAAARPNTGVRALFKGASGTGKTLSARLLANALGMDLYRIDLSAVVNKYIGETEKNLERVFAHAEALDVVLLLDEGDSLLTRRTEVNTANDRYANLETNFLLQRIESYTGILLVTTNAASDRIDGAFTRRMDAVIEFAPPQALQRLAIWHLHLPEGHVVEPSRLWELADRCALTGGQIRNAALHAALLAMDAGKPLAGDELLAAVRREYRKSGTVCPVPTTA